MIRAAAKVVCLTEKAASVLAEWYLADDPKALGRFQVVPCCADFSLFDPSRVSEADLARARAIAGVSPDDFVLLYLGSLGPDYLLDRMMALFVQLVKERSTARFVFLSNNGEELVQSVCAAHGVSRERISLRLGRPGRGACLSCYGARVGHLHSRRHIQGRLLANQTRRTLRLWRAGDRQRWRRRHGSYHRPKNERVRASRGFLRHLAARGGEEDPGNG